MGNGPSAAPHEVREAFLAAVKANDLKQVQSICRSTKGNTFTLGFGIDSAYVSPPNINAISVAHSRQFVMFGVYERIASCHRIIKSCDIRRSIEIISIVITI
jgi:hypothetical protein